MREVPTLNEESLRFNVREGKDVIQAAHQVAIAGAGQYHLSPTRTIAGS